MEKEKNLKGFLNTLSEQINALKFEEIENTNYKLNKMQANEMKMKLSHLNKLNTFKYDHDNQFKEIFDELQERTTKLINKKLENLKPEYNNDSYNKRLNEEVTEYKTILEDFSNSSDGNLGFYDMLMDFTSQYKGSSNSVRKIIEDLQNNGHDIHIIADKVLDKTDFHDEITSFSIILPSSSYKDLNNKLFEKHSNILHNVSFGEFREHYLIPNFNENLTLDDFKKIGLEHDFNTEDYIDTPIREKLNISTIRFNGNNNDPEENINFVVKEALSSSNTNSFIIHNKNNDNIFTAASEYNNSNNIKELLEKQKSDLNTIKRINIVKPK